MDLKERCKMQSFAFKELFLRKFNDNKPCDKELMKKLKDLNYSFLDNLIIPYSFEESKNIIKSLMWNLFALELERVGVYDFDVNKILNNYSYECYNLSDLKSIQFKNENGEDDLTYTQVEEEQTVIITDQNDPILKEFTKVITTNILDYRSSFNKNTIIVMSPEKLKQYIPDKWLKIYKTLTFGSAKIDNTFKKEDVKITTNNLTKEIKVDFAQ
ncbi:MAG: hypothetical protein ABSG25_05750 [Bryobacteraceae bacterium]